MSRVREKGYVVNVWLIIYAVGNCPDAVFQMMPNVPIIDLLNTLQSLSLKVKYNMDFAIS
jgi:hypothetical protein